MRVFKCPFQTCRCSKTRRLELGLETDFVFEHPRADFECARKTCVSMWFDTKPDQRPGRRFITLVRGQQKNAAVVLAEHTLKPTLPVRSRPWWQRIAEIDDGEPKCARSCDPLGCTYQSKRTGVPRDMNHDEGVEVHSCTGKVRRKERSVFGLHPGDQFGARLRADHTRHRRRRPCTSMPTRDLGQPLLRQHLSQSRLGFGRPHSSKLKHLRFGRHGTHQYTEQMSSHKRAFYPPISLWKERETVRTQAPLPSLGAARVRREARRLRGLRPRNVSL